MKRLTSITATNFKGLTFTTPLSPATLLVGANFAGKTARTDAIRLLLLGYLPELGKNNKDTMELASSREMAVFGQFDDGASISRTFRLKGNSVSKEEVMPKEIEAATQLAVMLNAEEYFALGDRARVEYVFAHCAAGDMTVDKVVARVSAIYKQPWPSGNEHNITAHEFVSASIEHFTDKAKTSKSYAVRMEGTIQGLAALRAGDDQAALAANLTALDGRRQEIEKRRRQIDERRATLKAIAEQVDKVACRREVISREFSAVNVDGLRAKLDALRQDFAKVTVPDEPDQSHVQALQKKEMDLNAELAKVRNDYTNAQSLHALATKELQELEFRTTCPYCGASGSHWKVLKQNETKTNIAAYADVIEIAKATGLRLKDEVTSVQFKLKAQADAMSARAAAITEQGHISREIHQLEVTLSRLDAMAEELKSLPEADEGSTELADISTKLMDLQAELNKVETDRRNAMGRQHELGRLAQAEEERDKAKVEAEQAKLATDELRVIQGEMVDSAFKPLLERANLIFGELLRSPLAYRDGEIGTWRDGLWVGHKTFSGLEKALTYAAIQAALTSTSPLRVMIIDELGRLTDDKIQAVVDLALNAIEHGYIDQFIGIEARTDYSDIYDELVDQSEGMLTVANV